MCERCIGKEIGHAVVAGTGHKAVAGIKVEVETHACLNTFALKIDNAENIIETDAAPETGSSNQRAKGFKSTAIKHGYDLYIRALRNLKAGPKFAHVARECAPRTFAPPR